MQSCVQSHLKYIWVLVLVFIATCSTKRNEATETSINIPIPPSSLESGEKFFSEVELTDTIINEVKFKFTKISKQEFESYFKKGETPLQVSNHQNVAEERDSCVLVKLNNGKIDSLCARREGDNLMQYSVKGIWEGHNLVLLSYTDWEGGNDFFVNLKDGSGYNLGAEYLASSDERFLLSFSNSNKNLLDTSQLLFAEVGTNSIRTIFLMIFEKITVTEAAWIDNNKCIISTAAIEGIDEPIQPMYYMVTIN